MKKKDIRRRAVELKELEAILERAREAPLSGEDHDKLKGAVDTLAFLTRELETKGTSIQRLRRLLFGSSTETTRRVLGEAEGSGKDADRSAGSAEDAAKTQTTTNGGHTEKAKRPGHGRNGAVAYRGAEKVTVAHESLTHKAVCPACARGKVYTQPKPAPLLRVTGMAPLQATVYELERLRCNSCGLLFTANPPEGVGTAKYDESATAMIGLLKYGCGLPFYRLQKLETSLGIPLPAATQWELVRDAAGLMTPAHQELIRQAAQGTVLHNDDTAMRILDLEESSPAESEVEDSEAKDPEERTGVFTSGIVSTVEGQQIALFFTGRQHAGENLSDVLAQRALELAAPIQMCDALSRNTPGEFQTILANCLAHGRRRFVDVAENFPDECRYVLETLRDVYRNDALARERAMTSAERLAFHSEQSGPLMDGLEKWLKEQIEERKVEPNSGLGEAIKYMRKHWQELTLFLRQAGAPLDNNICERALKRVILHRKNALFYKTEAGARVGDLFMSLIHTAELGEVDPFDYLVALLRHPEELKRNPGRWMSWNYAETLVGPTSGKDPPA